MARSSFVLGLVSVLSLIVGMATWWFVAWLVSLLASALALVAGYAGRSEPAGTSVVGGLDMALTGIVLGWLVLALSLLVLFFVTITTLG